MLTPNDYSDAALADPLTRQIMDKITLLHGGSEYDKKYPDGIPTSLAIEHASLGRLESGLVMYPEGHARNSSGMLDELLTSKFDVLTADGVNDPKELAARLSDLRSKSAADVRNLYNFEIRGALPRE
jgi:2-methylcitrate dehydratase